ncbi:MAG: imidazolonepropionase [Elusimicrobiales bacterium]|nr:imidazolonepropionase [Elusimicrobiales bacterium]
MALLIENISQLITVKGERRFRIGKELCELSIIYDGAIFIEEGIIRKVGKRKDVISQIKKDFKFEVIDAGGRVVMPGFFDCHTHSIFAKPRINDFEMRIKGMSYCDIKKAGGGINLSAKHIKESSLEELSENLLNFSKRFIECGTLGIEVKSGYGLDLDGELKMLKAAREVSNKISIDIVTTFLGAHSIPQGLSSKEYLQFLKEKVLPIVKEEKLAKFVDIFCEKGYFEVEESIDYLNYAKSLGFVPRVHADQLSKSGGSIVASIVGAVSADHLDWADEEYIKKLKYSNVACVFLPASNYFLDMNVYPKVRKFIEEGCVVILSTDFNPGTSPCWNMQFVISLALIKMKMSLEEAIVASTYNPAFLLGFGDKAGMIEEGMNADIIILDIKNYKELGYYFGDNLNIMSIKKGKVIWKKNRILE